MKKICFGIMTLLLLFLGACSNDEASPTPKNESPSKAAATDAGSSEDPSDKQNEYAVKKKIDQLGNESLGGSVSDYEKAKMVESKDSIYILKKPDDYSSTLEVEVSIFKKGKWTAKNKKTDITQIILGGLDTITSYQAKYFGNKILFITKEQASTEAKEEIFTYKLISFDEKGDPSVKKIHTYTRPVTTEVTEDNVFEIAKVIPSTFGDILWIQKEEKHNQHRYMAIDETGKEILSFEDTKKLLANKEQNLTTKMNMSDTDFTFLDAKNHSVYYASGQLPVKYFAFDTKKEKLVYDKTGKEQEIEINPMCSKLDSNNKYVSVIPTKEGMLTLYDGECMGRNKLVISDVKLDANQNISLNKFGFAAPDLEPTIFALGADKKEVRLYTLVQYQGEPTVQQFIYE